MKTQGDDYMPAEEPLPIESPLIPHSQISLLTEPRHKPDFTEKLSKDTSLEKALPQLEQEIHRGYWFEEQDGKVWRIIRENNIFYKKCLNTSEEERKEITFEAIREEIRRFCNDSIILADHLMTNALIANGYQATCHTEINQYFEKNGIMFNTSYKRKVNVQANKTLLVKLKKTGPDNITFTSTHAVTNFFAAEENSATDIANETIQDGEIVTTIAISEENGTIIDKVTDVTVNSFNKETTNFLVDKLLPPERTYRRLPPALQEYIENGLKNILSLQAKTDKTDDNRITSALTNQLMQDVKLITNDKLDTLCKQITQLKPASSFTEEQKKITAQANHLIKILETQKKYCGKGHSDPERLSTKQYLTELKEIRLEYKPNLFENLLGKLNIVKTARYNAYHNLKGVINTIDANWKKVKQHQASQLKSKPESIISDMKLANIYKKLKNKKEAETYYKKAIETLNDATKTDTRKELAADIAQLEYEREQVLTELKQFAKKSPDAAYSRLKQWRSSLNNKTKPLADYSDEQINEEIISLRNLIQVISLRQNELRPGSNKAPLPIICHPKTGETIQIPDGSNISSIVNEISDPEFKILLNHIESSANIKELCIIAEKLLIEFEKRTHFVQLKAKYIEEEQKILQNSADTSAISASKLAKYNELHTKLAEIRSKLDIANQELITASVTSSVAKEYLTATNNNSRKHIPTNHSNFLHNMHKKTHYRQIKEREAMQKRVEDGMAKFSGGTTEDTTENEVPAAPAPALR